MKDKIHPKYFADARIICSCGNVMVTGGTRKEVKVEVCSKCHPFFTGEQRIADTEGRVERFRRRYKLAEKAAAEAAAGGPAKKAVAELKTESPKKPRKAPRQKKVAPKQPVQDTPAEAPVAEVPATPPATQ